MGPGQKSCCSNTNQTQNIRQYCIVLLVGREAKLERARRCLILHAKWKCYAPHSEAARTQPKMAENGPKSDNCDGRRLSISHGALVLHRRHEPGILHPVVKRRTDATRCRKLHIHAIHGHAMHPWPNGQDPRGVLQLGVVVLYKRERGKISGVATKGWTMY